MEEFAIQITYAQANAFMAGVAVALIVELILAAAFSLGFKVKDK